MTKFLDIDGKWNVPYSENSDLGKAKAEGKKLETAWHDAQELLARRQSELAGYQAELDAITADTDPVSLVEPLALVQAARLVVEKCEQRVSSTHAAMSSYEHYWLLASKVARLARNLAKLLDADQVTAHSPNQRAAAIEQSLSALETITGIRPDRSVFNG